MIAAAFNENNAASSSALIPLHDPSAAIHKCEAPPVRQFNRVTLYDCNEQMGSAGRRDCALSVASGRPMSRDETPRLRGARRSG
jgi:hypothetical protein